MHISIAIVEDSTTESDLLKRYLKKMESENLSFEIYVFDSAEKLLKGYSSGIYHLIFFDIQLEGMDGLSAARRVRVCDNDVIIVFITNMAQFAINGYEVSAKDYIVKPVIYDVFLSKMKRILPAIKQKRDSFISISSVPGSTNAVPVDNIRYVEVFGHKLIYHCIDREYEVVGKLHDAESRLEPFRFIRCNRSTIINPHFVTYVRHSYLELSDICLPITATYRENVLNKLSEWIVR